MKLKVDKTENPYSILWHAFVDHHIGSTESPVYSKVKYGKMLMHRISWKVLKVLA